MAVIRTTVPCVLAAVVVVIVIVIVVVVVVVVVRRTVTHVSQLVRVPAPAVNAALLVVRRARSKPHGKSLICLPSSAPFPPNIYIDHQEHYTSGRQIRPLPPAPTPPKAASLPLLSDSHRILLPYARWEGGQSQKSIPLEA